MLAPTTMKSFFMMWTDKEIDVNIEIILGVALVVISIGNYILYTGLRNKITLLEEIVTSNDKERDLWVKIMDKQTDRLKKLENKCKYSEK